MGGLQKGTKFHMLCVHANPEGAAAKHQAHAKGSGAAASFFSRTGGQQQVGGEGLVSLVEGMLAPQNRRSCRCFGDAFGCGEVGGQGRVLLARTSPAWFTASHRAPLSGSKTSL